jgi:hypothetical protein
MPPLPSIPSSSGVLSILRRSILLPRQDIVAIPNTYSDINNSPAPGTVVGIVLGSVGGFLLILWLISTCFGFRIPSSASTDEESISVRSYHRRSNSRSYSPPRPAGRRAREEVVEIHRSPSRRKQSQTQQSRRKTITVEARRSGPRRSGDDDEIVEIVDEGGPRRSSRNERVVSGGFVRAVETESASGNRPVDEVFVRKGSKKTRR